MPERIHDLLYLSDQKLDSMIVENKFFQRSHLSAKAQAQVNAPPFLAISLEAATESADSRVERQAKQIDLAKLKKVINEIGKQSYRYADPDVEPGYWVHFESRMNNCIMEEKYFKSAVIFSDHGKILTDPAVRLLLHGSTQHLRTQARVVDLTSEVEQILRSPSSAEFVYALADGVDKVIRTIQTAQDPMSLPPSTRARPKMSAGLLRLLGALDAKLEPGTASFVRGLARVTAAVETGRRTRVERIVMATPLFVEYAGISATRP